MIITRTPFRISFAGGGSDLQKFYSKAGGAVLSTTINKFMYISTHKFFEPDKIRVKYSQTETVSSLKDLRHPILRTALDQFSIEGGMEISSIADVPAGTGMGSSSSFTVGLLHNLRLIRKQTISKEILADGACHIEIDLLHEPIGKQDQYAASYGGLNLFEFNPDGSVTVLPVHLDPEVSKELQNNLILFYTGDQRDSSSVLAEQTLNLTNDEKFKTLEGMVSLVYQLRDELLNGSLDAVGKILHENWEFKKKLAEGISTGPINDAYDLALKNGALGGKLLGAGGGGFLLFYCPQSRQKKLIEALQPLRTFDFKFEHEGSKLIHYSDE